jgi:hypothetical protein
VRRVPAADCPLDIQNEHLRAIGVRGADRRQTLGDTMCLAFIIRFYAGWALYGSGTAKLVRVCRTSVRAHVARALTTAVAQRLLQCTSAELTARRSRQLDPQVVHHRRTHDASVRQ